MAALDHMTSGSEGSDDDVQPVRLPGDLVPRPVWTGLTIMPRIQVGGAPPARPLASVGVGPALAVRARLGAARRRLRQASC